ncbi:MAG: redoxin domain-containing protein [Elusimicrobia bacterium]|nr:redoxin domain-containing protein [Elusimicrobiota bacterium]MDE2312664.1 redoxin domain-containing protein [Elusimicrobiota bacterium]
MTSREKRNLKLGAAALCALSAFFALFLVSRVEAFADKAPAVGSAAPGFTLHSESGKPVSLYDYRGKWVVLYFYPKDFSPGCTIEAHRFERDIKKYRKLGAVILGVSMQSAATHAKFCAKEGLDFKLLADPDGRVSRLYGSVLHLIVTTLSSRHTFLITPQGVIAKEYLHVNPYRHSAQVLSDLAALEASPSSGR